jgi:uncharacterized membrane protein
MPIQHEEGFPVFWLVGGALVVVGVAGVVFLLRGKPEKPSKAVEKVSYDLDRLFSEVSHLRMDDKEVVRYLADNGGESFAAEIRERFEIPRTSLWRMIRRLEGEGVIIVESIGGQSLVRINTEYRARGG